MKKPNDPLSGATMQIDVSDLEPRPEEAAPKSRATPPPLPPQAFVPPPPAPARDPRKLVLYGALFLAFLAAAIFGGVKAGLALRGPTATAPTAPAPPPAAPGVISIPMVEVPGAADAQ